MGVAEPVESTEALFRTEPVRGVEPALGVERMLSVERVPGAVPALRIEPVWSAGPASGREWTLLEVGALATADCVSTRPTPRAKAIGRTSHRTWVPSGRLHVGFGCAVHRCPSRSGGLGVPGAGGDGSRGGDLSDQSQTNRRLKSPSGLQRRRAIPQAREARQTSPDGASANEGNRAPSRRQRHHAAVSPKRSAQSPARLPLRARACARQACQACCPRET